MLSILYYIFTVIHTTVWCIISALVLAVTYPFDKSRRLVHECSRYMTWVFFGLPPRVRRTIDGVENIDRRKSYVIVLNHTSGVDIIAAYKIPLNFRWVSKREVFRIPFFGPMLLVHGDIPIERGNAAAAMAKVVHQGKIWLGRGASVAIFPEGTRSKDGEIHRFKAGAFTLAKEAGGNDGYGLDVPRLAYELDQPYTYSRIAPRECRGGVVDGDQGAGTDGAGAYDDGSGRTARRGGRTRQMTASRPQGLPLRVPKSRV